jgi:hypothetical protein
MLAGVLAAWAAGGARAEAGDRVSLVDPSLVDPLTEQALVRAPRGPFTATFQRSGRRLTFVATIHDVARTGPTFRAIERAFAQRPEALIAEGFPSSWGFNPPQIADVVRRAQTEPRAATSFTRGDPGHAIALALAQHVPFCGGEPDDSAIDRALVAQGFARDDIAGVKVLQWIPQGRIAGEFANPRDPRFAVFLSSVAARVADDAASPNRYDRTSFERWHRAQFGVSVYDDPSFDRRLDPGRGGREPEAVRAAMNLLVDRHVFALTMRTLGTYRRLLVVYGSAHLITQWRALSAALGRPRLS